MNRQRLFSWHAQDLSAVLPSGGVEGFVCPICFRLFKSEDLEKPNTLTRGHVWPRSYFRNQSEEASRQVVLLCFQCNSSGGHTFDAAMQEYEHSRARELVGEAYTTRYVTIIPKDDSFTRRVRMRLFVLKSDGMLTKEQQDTVDKNQGISLRIQAGAEAVGIGLYPRIDEKGRKHYDEREWIQALEIIKTEPFSLIIEPYNSNWVRGKSLDIPYLWQAGLLTSAYLYAFYTFGYRYVFQVCLDPVREYILQAFNRQVDSRLNFEPTKTMTVAHLPDYFENPDIGFFNPMGSSEETYHMRISMGDHAVWLPIQYTYQLQMDGSEHNGISGITMSATGHRPHPGSLCHWDVLLGEPDYELRGDQIVPR